MTAAHSISLLTIGSEIVDGRMVDTNSAVISSFFAENGYTVSRQVSCADDSNDIITSLKFLCTESKVIVVTGGLGPTSDDISRESIAALAGKGLEQSSESLERLRQFFAESGRGVAESNLKQALFPEGARILINHVGTADGFELSIAAAGDRQATLLVLPGVPREMEKMLRGVVIDRVRSLLPTPCKADSLYFHCFGVPESVAQSKITELDLDSAIAVSYRASFPVVTVRLVFDGSLNSKQDLCRNVVAALGEEFVFSKKPGGSLSKTVHSLLVEAGTTVATAESCTGGMIGSMLTGNAGSSDYFVGGAVSYSNRSKIDCLGVAAESLETFGAVSETVACEMAAGARSCFHSDIAVSVTGIAGPGGGSPDKPVGTFFIGLATANEVRAGHYFYNGSRATIRRIAASVALDTLRRELLGLAPLTSYVRPSEQNAGR